MHGLDRPRHGRKRGLSPFLIAAPSTKTNISSVVRTIGRYRIEAEVGRGAMGVVYRAHDPELHRTVAVKTYTLPPGLDAAQQAEFHARSRREAQAAAALSHPGIVTIFDAGEDAETGTPFLAMEYVPGRSLASLLEDERTLPLERVRTMVATLAGALGAAHAAGIVHRDVKPANLLVHQKDGSMKVADFGVARVSTSTLTRSGSSMGSPAYMSPEQIRGRPVDGRADLFSLAVILYETLCGDRPFAADDIPGLVYAIAHQTPVPVSRRNVALPLALDDFFDRALAKDPDGRFADAAEFAREFDRAAAAAVRDAAPSWADPRSRPAAPTGALAVDAPLLVPPKELGEEVVGPSRRVALLAAAAGFALMILGAAIFGKEDAHLLLDGKSRMDGELVLSVDGKEVYDRTLQAPSLPPGTEPGLVKRVSRTLTGSDYESFEALIDIDAGKRQVEVIITPEMGEPFRSSLVVELQPGETRRLRLVAGRSLGSSLSFHAD